jgi:hypothetical protein
MLDIILPFGQPGCLHNYRFGARIKLEVRVLCWKSSFHPDSWGVPITVDSETAFSWSYESSAGHHPAIRTAGVSP